MLLGATGDLAYRKLLPGLYHLHADDLLPRGFALVGFASPDMSTDQYRQAVNEAIRKSAPALTATGQMWEDFAKSIHYARRTENLEQSFADLKDVVERADAQAGASDNYLFYFAVPPFVVEQYADVLAHVELANVSSGGWRRIVVEKPFGEDLGSAKTLNKALQAVFAEEQIYRIDHYLGKETVQNMLVFRFGNRFVEPLLNADHVDHVQVTVGESVGVEQRGGFYDSTGALKDMVQNHILQMLSVIAMEQPASLDPEDIRDRRIELLRSVRRYQVSDVGKLTVRGQYRSGQLLSGEVLAYRQEPKVDPHSDTETYAALKILIDNQRWRGVPFYVRTGKRLAKRVTEIAIALKPADAALFSGGTWEAMDANVIALNIQPRDGISIRFEAKSPGPGYRLHPVKMDFHYETGFKATAPDAYERLILDALRGDPSLYSRADATEATWEIVQPILEAWKSGEVPMTTYTPGSWGPVEAEEMIGRDGRAWRRL